MDVCTSFQASIISVLVNIATHMPAYQSRGFDMDGRGAASVAVDGKYSGNDPHTLTRPGPQNWWAVDLGRTVTVSKVALTNRLDCCREFNFCDEN